jgi:hypothetical protein
MALSAYVWLAGVVCCLIGGVAIVPAVGEATLAAGGGLAAWGLYRQVSGRLDGLAIIMLAVMGPSRHILDGPSIGIVATACMVVVLLLTAPVAGLFVRGSHSTGGQAAAEQNSGRARKA